MSQLSHYIASSVLISDLFRYLLCVVPADPTSIIFNDYNMDKAIAYLKKLNESSDVHITMTHLVGYASAWGAYKMRRDIGRIKFGTFKKTHKMGISFMIDIDHGKNMAYVTVHDGHKMTL